MSSSGVGTAKAREKCGPACDSSSARRAGGTLEKHLKCVRHSRGWHGTAIHGDMAPRGWGQVCTAAGWAAEGDGEV